MNSHTLAWQKAWRLAASAGRRKIEISPDIHDVVGSETPEGLKATEVSEAVDQAVAAGQPDKIMPFVKAVAQAHPDALNEIVKIVKVCIHDAVMKRTIDPEQAAKIAEELNAIVAGPSEAGA